MYVDDKSNTVLAVYYGIVEGFFEVDEPRLVVRATWVPFQSDC